MEKKTLAYERQRPKVGVPRTTSKVKLKWCAHESMDWEEWSHVDGKHIYICINIYMINTESYLLVDGLHMNMNLSELFYLLIILDVFL